jgi:hypothetical protein
MGQAVAIPIAAAVAAAVAGAGAAAVLAPSTKPPAPIAPPTRDDAAAAAANDKTFRLRRGAAANMVTGPNGAEAPSPGAKALLGQ